MPITAPFVSWIVTRTSFCTWKMSNAAITCGCRRRGWWRYAPITGDYEQQCRWWAWPVLAGWVHMNLLARIVVWLLALCPLRGMGALRAEIIDLASWGSMWTDVREGFQPRQTAQE